MRILHGADAHVGFAVPGYPDATSQALRLFVDTATSLDIDLAILSGDTFHSRRPTPSQILTVVECLMRLRENDIPVVIGTGNHDGLSVIGDARSHTLRWLEELDIAGITVMTERAIERIETNAGAVEVGHLPYPHKRGDDAELAIDERIRRASEEAALGVEFLAVSGAQFLVAHVTVAGAMLDSERAMQIGWDATIPEEVLKPFEYAALGHIHAGQKIADNAYYPGSMVSMGWDGGTTGFILRDSHEIGRVKWIVDAGPEWMAIEIREDQDWLIPSIPHGAVVKATLVPTGRLGPMDARRVVDALTAAGAGFVRVEVEAPAPITSGSGPRPDSLETLDVLDLMETWLAARGIPATSTVLTAATDVVHSVRNVGEA